MRGVPLLALRHLAHRRGQAAVVVGALALALFLPAAVSSLIARYEADLAARAASTPLVAGAKGNRFDLTLAVLSFRPSSVEPIPLSTRGELEADGLALAIPVSLRFSTRGLPLAGVGFEYFALRGLAPAAGRLPVRLGDCVLGSEAARDLGLGVGDRLSSDPPQAYDISRPAALSMRVTGVLEPSRTADDQAVFVDIATASLLEGVLHGHDDQVDPALVLASDERTTVLSQALIEAREVDADALGDFHAHGDPGRQPVTAFVVVPRDAKAATILGSRINAGPAWQVVRPSEVVDDLMDFVFRIKSLFDVFATVLLVATLVLVGLIVTLTIQLRHEELAALERIGATRGTVRRLLAFEALAVVGAAALLAGLVLVVTLALGDRLLSVF